MTFSSFRKRLTLTIVYPFMNGLGKLRGWTNGMVLAYVRKLALGLIGIIYYMSS